MCGTNDKLMFLIVLALCLKCAHATQTVTVERLELPFEQLNTLTVNSSIEYIIDLTPTDEQASWPARVWFNGPGASFSRPVLITARQSTGALTWQLPWTPSSSPQGGLIMYELERTLCPLAAGGRYQSNSDCEIADESPSRVTLHIGSMCADSISVSFLVMPARDWLLDYQMETHLMATLAAPKVHHYAFAEGQESVRLIISSPDEVCAIVSVQNFSCPILESELEIQTAGQRMTIQSSGGILVSRRRYPYGFYVVTLVLPNNIECNGDRIDSDEDWLWNDLMWGIKMPESQPVRTKQLTLRIEPSLTRGEYAIATVVTLVFLGMFYLLFATAVFAQRFDFFRKYVEPALPPESGETRNTETDGQHTDSPRRARRDSNATFDSSDNSDTDSDAETGVTRVSGDPGGRTDIPRTPTSDDNTPRTPTSEDMATNAVATHTNVNGIQSMPDVATQPRAEASPTPFGLPPRLRLAALSRRHARVIQARSTRYLWMLITVAVFYALPVMQFVAAFQVLLNVSGSLDICYYNFLCAHPAGQVSDFNHIFSNLGYLLLGILFILQVNRRRLRRRKTPRNEEYGIPAHYGLLYSLGVAMMVVALLSATYHVCPNRLNFQFDTAFMYVMAVISMVKIYQSRHPDVNARAHSTFGILAVIIAIGVWGVLQGGALFWGLFTVVHIFTFLIISLRIYYVGQFRFEKERIQTAAREIASLPSSKPLYRPRMVMLLLANCANWAIALLGLWTQQADFASHLLQVLLGNLLLYMIFYLTMKLLHGERPRWYSWCFLAGALITWIPALYFFLSGSTSWSTTPAHSRALNHECRVLRFYDSHDLWHLLSAIALYLSFNAMLTWDDGLAAVKRTDIAVF